MNFIKEAPFTRLYKKKYKSRLRKIIRGHLRLRKHKELDKIHSLKRELALNKLKITDKKFSSLIFGKNLKTEDIEKSIRQYLLLRVANNNLNKVLLGYLGKKNEIIIHYLPKEWIKIFEINGFKVAKKWSAIYWRIYLLALICYSTLVYFKIIINSILAIIRRQNHDNSYIYFHNLTSLNIPKVNNKNNKFDIINWYIKYTEGKRDYNEIRHDATGTNQCKVDSINIVPSNKGPIPDLITWKDTFIFSIWGFSAIIFALLELIRGRWWHAFMLNQAMLAKKATLQNPKHLAREYLFHNTNQTYRPLWTYIAEKYGSKITLYFYSTNIESLNINPTYYWRCMSWPMYLVWDKYQSKFLERSLGSPQNTKIVGPIWWSDNADLYIPNMANDKNISIFGVTPHRYSKYCVYAEEVDYVIPEICNAFIEDILEIADHLKFKCVIKEKRDLPRSVIHPKYKNFVKDIIDNNNLTLVDVGVAPNKIIDLSKMVISFPFTATAIIAKEMGKPSCYYDPANIVSKNHHGLHGVTLINNKEDLLNWVKSHDI